MAQEFTQKHASNMSAEVNPSAEIDAVKRAKCDVLLNNFLIKKKRYRVLFNCNHIVWENWESKRQNDDCGKFAKIESESEQLSSGMQYEKATKVLHLDDIIRVAVGETKSATFRMPMPASNFENFAAGTQSNMRNNHHSSNTNKHPPLEQYLTIHYAERVVKSPTDCNRWRARFVTFYNADAYIVQQWNALLTKKLHESATRLKLQRILVFINPFGGRRQGLQVYERHCKPLFQLAGIDASCIVSQRANQIRDILMTHDLSPFDAICCVGGDGTVAEVINGLIFRTMHDQGLDTVQPLYIPKPTLPIAIIPAGSTDTIVYSMHGTADPQTAAIHVILGQRRGCDVCSIKNPQGIIRFCASVFSYGYLGDVAARSEKYRWMGTKRYEYTGAKAFITNRGYNAELHILKNDYDMDEIDSTPSDSQIDNTLPLDTICYANCIHCASAVSKHINEMEVNERPQTDSDQIDNDEVATSSSRLSFTGGEKNYGTMKDSAKSMPIQECDINGKVNSIKNTDVMLPNCDQDLQNKNNELKNTNNTQIETVDAVLAKQNDSTLSASSISASYNDNNKDSNNSDSCPSNLDTDIAKKWHIIRGDFFMISGANITCACSRSPNGISRYNHLGDGQLDLILVNKTSIVNNIRFAMNAMLRSGDIRKLPFVKIFRTRKFLFRAPFATDDSVRGSCQPITKNIVNSNDDNEILSSWNCDGEVVHGVEIEMSSHCQLIDVFMRGPYSFSKDESKSKHSKLCCCG